MTRIQALAAALILAGAVAAPQKNTGRIHGTVREPGGAAVPGITVTAAAGDSVHTAVTGPAGAYALALPPGAWTLIVEQQKGLPYRPARRRVTVEAGRDLEVHFALQVRAREQAAGSPETPAQWKSPYPRSPVIRGLAFDDRSERILANGSDIWPVTWAGDDHLYTLWGDGGGFGWETGPGIVSLGFARVEGGKRNYRGINVAGGKDAPRPTPFPVIPPPHAPQARCCDDCRGGGKSEGILAIGNTLYFWRDGETCDHHGFKWMELYRSDDGAASWRPTGVRFAKRDGTFPPGDEGFWAPAFCQFGKGYRSARDGYVYIYAPDIVDPSHWDIRKPGRIHLLRVPVSKIEQQSAYEFYAGPGPRWTTDPGARVPVWQDPVNGTHRVAASYNPVLRRYLLTSLTVSRDGWFTLYDAPEPWGPWTLAHVERNTARWGRAVIIFSFVNKWLTPDGRDFVILHTKNDHWATIEGRFELSPGALDLHARLE